MKAIILSRVSTKDQQEEGQSIPAQTRRLTEYATKKKFHIEHVFEIAESSLKDTRKEFDNIIRHIKKSKEPIALLLDCVDRLQRSFRETPLIDELRKSGILEIHFLRENLILNRNSANAQITQWEMGVIMAASYVRQLSDNVKRSKEQSVKNGEWSSKAPFGYKNVLLDSGRRGIVVDEQNAPYVTRMFELYASGLHSFQTVANEMDKVGVKNAHGRKILPSRIEETLKNPFYYGTMRIKGELHPHKYQPLITEALFYKAQQVMSGHNKAPVQYAGKPILLRGLIKCDHCGCTVTGDIKKEKYVYYSCGNSKKVCKKIWVNEETLLGTLLASFDRIKLTEDQIQGIVAHLKQAHAHEQAFFTNAQETLRKELDYIQDRSSKLLDVHLDGTIDQETYRTKMDEYKKRKREITSEMQAHVLGDETCLITIETVLGLARNAQEIFNSSNFDEKRQLLNFVYSNLKLNDGKLLVELREPFLSMAKMSDQPTWLGREDSNLRVPVPKTGALPLGYAPTKYF